jgi:IS1 family transposase
VSRKKQDGCPFTAVFGKNALLTYAYHDEHVRNLATKRVQVDEIWSFTYAKAKNVAKAKTAPANAGDTWTWTAIDAESKLMISWLVGGRDSDYAMMFMDDLRSRLANRVQLTSDGHRAYLEAVEGAFGDVDYAQLVKVYAASPESAKGRYSPAECTGALKVPVEGSPDPKHISTSFAERQNLNMRMHMRRFTRLTNAFSKKVENHAHNVALFSTFYNFVRIHKTLRVTPAMAAGVTDRLWEIGDIVALVEANDARSLENVAPIKRRARKFQNDPFSMLDPAQVLALSRSDPDFGWCIGGTHPAALRPSTIPQPLWVRGA